MAAEYGCRVCGKGRPKRLPYGAQRVLGWCSHCDADLVPSVSKKGARSAAKKEIRKQLDEISE